MAEHSFSSGQSNKHEDSPASEVMLRYREQLCSLSEFFLFEVDYRDITRVDIDKWIKELRDILKEMKKLQDDPHGDMLLITYAGVRDMLCKVLSNLFFASDILERGDHSIKYRSKRFYQIFMDCSILLSNTVEMYFRVVTSQERSLEKLESELENGGNQML
jgi:hypothetical protein